MCVSSLTGSSCTKEDVTDASDVVQTIQKLSSASQALSRTEAVLTQKIAEASKVVMEYGIAKLVAAAGSECGTESTRRLAA